MNLTPEKIEEARSLLKNSQKIVITNHVNPDSDAIGSAVGLQLVLKELGIESSIIVPNEFPSFLQWMADLSDSFLVFEKDKEAASQKIQAADLTIHLDYNALKRSGSMEGILKESSSKKMTIDHHQQPEGFEDWLFSDTEMSSTAEMVFHFVEALGWADKISLQAAECLYSGMMTDTGNFRYSATKPTTHLVAAKLLMMGVQPQIVASRIYDTNTRNRLKLLSRALEKMEVFEESKAALISLNEKDLKYFNAQKGDTEGFVNYGLSIEGIVLSVFIKEQDGKVKLSFRSMGDFDVNTLAREHFKGGGHRNAAGAAVEDSFENVLQKVKEILPNYEAELQKV